MEYTITLFEEALIILKEQQKKNKLEGSDINLNTILLHSLDRLSKNLHSIIILLKSSPYENEHLIELGLRNILTDFFVVAYLFNEKEKSSKIIEDLIDHDKGRIKKYFVLRGGKGEIPEGYHNESLKSKISNFPTTTELYKKIIEKITDCTDATIRTDNAYDKWSYFSKAEHIGWASYLKINSPIDDYDMEKVLLECLISAMYSAIISQQMLCDLDACKSIKSVYSKIEDYLKARIQPNE